MRQGWYSILIAAILLASCNSSNQKKTHGPIVLGDPSTIITETDSQNLKDFVADFKPVIPSEENLDSVKEAQKAQDTTSKIPVAPAETPAQQQAVPPATGNALTVTFNEVTVIIPGITTKSYRNQDPKKGNGVSYQLTSGTLTNSQLKVVGNVTKVSQHYQTIVILKNSLGTLPLDALGSTSAWAPLNGSNNTYNILLDPNKIEHKNASAAEIKKAVERAVRSHRISRNKSKQWLSSVNGVHSVTDAPLKVVLHNITWKIEGKDASGKPYQKQLRLDIP